jgi:hypothetical protein
MTRATHRKTNIQEKGLEKAPKKDEGELIKEETGTHGQ